MACGTPVVTTDVGDIRYYLGEEAGVLRQPEDIEGLSQELLTLTKDRDRRLDLSIKARNRALEFTFAQAAAKLMSVYATLGLNPGSADVQ
jgi:glycosyltransferase involved in cell wall biosynthesis